MNLLGFGSVLIGIALAAISQDAIAQESRDVPGVWKKEWNEVLGKSLTASNLLNHKESQIEQLCQGYEASKEKRNLFWRQLFISLAWKESSHGPGNFLSFNGGINIGLYQLDPRLKSAYRCEGNNLYDAATNIQCAVRMAAHLIKKHGSFLKGTKEGMAAYWQPLRSTSSLNLKNRTFILASATKACKTGKLNYISTSRLFQDALDEPREQVPNTLDDLGLSLEELDPMEFAPPSE